MSMRTRPRGLASLVLLAGAIFGSGRPARAAPDADLVAALDAAGGADVVAFELPAAPHAPRVRAATITRASVATVLGVLADPARYGTLIPALVRSQEVGRRGDARVVEWELEIPLFNLSGTLEVRPRAGGVEVALIGGDLSPGRVVFEVAARPDGRTTVQVDARLDVARSSFFLRRVMARSEYGEPAALSAAAWVALRATALRAEHARDASAFRPTAPPERPTPGQPDGRALLRHPFERLAARGAAALVAVAPSGRLADVSVSVTSRDAPTALAARLADPRSWHAFPGWRHVQPMPPTATAPATVVVEDGIPFVDFDATWRAEPAPRARCWTAIDGAARGAWFAWNVAAGASSTEAVLTMAPRLEATGSIPRRFIEAEPLLEHGLSLALAFVDAVSATRSGAK
jgi:hypothetical protein